MVVVGGQLEIVFKPSRGLIAALVFPLSFIAFLAAGLSLSTWVVLSKTFKYLNPSKVVPSRVRDAYDSLSSGLVLMTNTGEIAHSNSAFDRISGGDAESNLGRQLDSFEWRLADEGATSFPWNRCRETKIVISGEVIEADITEGVTQKYLVNATPIFGTNDSTRGVLVSFEDVTALEAKKYELSQIIQTVRMSRDEVERQNEKLNFLASYDPLTKCMNRRAFFGHFEQAWAEAKDNNLSLIIMDIDFFKSVNDNHGHSTGDQVLTAIGEVMTRVTGQKGMVCRYGGEEFVVMVPDLDLVKSCVIAEEIRLAIEKEPIAGLSITASLGVSNLQFGPMDPQHMLDQADHCLYAAKRNGRNQVVRFDECPTESEQVEDDIANSAPQEKIDEIEYSSVTGLLSALSFRSPTTAEHSIRVADLSVAISQNLLNNRELYRLEIAALLHDIGKIGVPDAILNKPGQLTNEEMEIMRRHDEMGVAIVRSAFASEEVAKTIERHHYSSDAHKNDTKPDEHTPLASRILNVCDAFDSMVTDQIYRNGISPADALNEIKANSPHQFDPICVNHLQAFLESGEYKPHQKDVHLISGEAEPTLANNMLQANQHAHDLYEAIASKDFARIQSAVENLKEDAKILPATKPANSLRAVEGQHGDSDFEKLLELADEVLALSKETRSTFVENGDIQPSTSFSNS